MLTRFQMALESPLSKAFEEAIGGGPLRKNKRKGALYFNAAAFCNLTTKLTKLYTKINRKKV